MRLDGELEKARFPCAMEKVPMSPVSVVFLSIDCTSEGLLDDSGLSLYELTMLLRTLAVLFEEPPEPLSVMVIAVVKVVTF